MTTVTYIF